MQERITTVSAADMGQICRILLGLGEKREKPSSFVDAGDFKDGSSESRLSGEQKPGVDYTRFGKIGKINI